MESGSARVTAQRPFYSRHADAYDLLITDPVEPWVDAVHDRLLRVAQPRAQILDAGCGTGRHAAALIAKGHHVDLADASRELLARASERCPGARAFLVDLCATDLPPVYAAVTCRGVLNDMTTDEERDLALASLTRCLRPGGLLFLDVREERASRLRADGASRRVVVDLDDRTQLTYSTRTTWHEGLLRVKERYELSLDGRVRDDSTYDFTMRPWSTSELSSALWRNGMRHIDIAGGVGRRTPDRVFVVASRSVAYRGMS
jgi:SAM-dependent methyltransferase